MHQLQLPMLTYYEGPRLIDQELVLACRSYREAVRACWDLRTRRNLTRRALAEGAGLYASHVSDYLTEDDAKRELPAKHINAFEVECGNRFVSQWLARQAGLTILEQFMQKRAA
jgi:hypothetical protein